jgi:hypothetical protein
MDEVQKSSNNECYTPSSESFRTNFILRYLIVRYHPTCSYTYIFPVHQKFYRPESWLWRNIDDKVPDLNIPSNISLHNFFLKIRN